MSGAILIDGDAEWVVVMGRERMRLVVLIEASHCLILVDMFEEGAIHVIRTLKKRSRVVIICEHVQPIQLVWARYTTVTPKNTHTTILSTGVARRSK